jgi:hypothetical protein
LTAGVAALAATAAGMGGAAASAALLTAVLKGEVPSIFISVLLQRWKKPRTG